MSLRTLDDADALIGAAQKAKSVALLGASFIGIGFAAQLGHRNLPVTVIANDDVSLVEALGKEVGRVVRGSYDASGSYNTR